MNQMSRILAIAVSIIFLGLVIELIRRRRLKEKYAILWISSGIVILILAVFNNILYWFTGLLGIIMPINTVFFFGIFFLILINLHFSMAISHLGEQNKLIARKLAMLEAHLQNQNKKSNL